MRDVRGKGAGSVSMGEQGEQSHPLPVDTDRLPRMQGKPLSLRSLRPCRARRSTPHTPLQPVQLPGGIGLPRKLFRLVADVAGEAGLPLGSPSTATLQAERCRRRPALL